MMAQPTEATAQLALTVLRLKPGAMAFQPVGLPRSGIFPLPNTHHLSLGRGEGEAEHEVRVGETDSWFTPFS